MHSNNLLASCTSCLIIPIFDSFNTFLQAEVPLIDILYHSTLRLYRSLLLRFILLKVISDEMMC